MGWDLILTGIDIHAYHRQSDNYDALAESVSGSSHWGPNAPVQTPCKHMRGPHAHSLTHAHMLNPHRTIQVTSAAIPYNVRTVLDRTKKRDVCVKS